MGIQLMLDRLSEKPLHRDTKCLSSRPQERVSLRTVVSSIRPLYLVRPPCFSRQETCRDRWAGRQTDQALMPPALAVVCNDVHRNKED